MPTLRAVIFELAYRKIIDAVVKPDADAFKPPVHPMFRANKPAPQAAMPIRSAPAPQPAALRPAMPTTAETVKALKQRLAQELYMVEGDLRDGARISGKPCDCLTEGKHGGAVIAMSKELMSYEVNPTLSEIVTWYTGHLPEFQPAAIAERPPEYYQGLTPVLRTFRKGIMGTEDPMAMLNDKQKAAVMQKAEAPKRGEHE